MLEGLARNLKDLHFFIGKLNFEDPDPNGTANKVVAKIRKALYDELLEEKNKQINFQHAWKNAFSCMAECFFCGARCDAIDSCED